MTREEAIEAIKCNWPDSRYTILREALDMAISALRQQEPNDWICTLKCTALMDEGMCSHGGLCCLYESQRTIKENQPLTLGDLVELGIRAENGENIIVYCTPLNDWAKVFKFGLLFFGTEGYRSWPEIEEEYGKTWLVYRQKPEEGTE